MAGSTDFCVVVTTYPLNRLFINVQRENTHRPPKLRCPDVFALECDGQSYPLRNNYSIVVQLLQVDEKLRDLWFCQRRCSGTAYVLLGWG